jgi:hypothetical protein
MPYEVISIVDRKTYVRTVDGKEVERRPATQQELAIIPLSPEEQAAATKAQTESNNAGGMRQWLADAQQSNRDFLDIATPTTNQTNRQIKDLTRQNIRMIRLLTNALDADS